MFKRHPSGLSLIVIIVGVAVFLTAIFIFIAVNGRQAAVKRDESRLQILHLVAQAEEFYFDRYKKYGSFDELVAGNLLDEIPYDKVSQKVYNLYRTERADDWCFWLEMEQFSPNYWSISSIGQKKLILPPIDLETCQQINQ